MDRDLNVLKHMHEYCVDIETDSKRLGDDYDVFKNDKMYQKAITMSLLQIGELSNQLTDAFKSSTAGQMDWRGIKGLRNMLAHRYGTMQPSLVWDIKTNDIPQLKEFCENHISILRDAAMKSSHTQEQPLRNDLIEQQKQCGGYTPPVTPVKQEQSAPEQTQTAVSLPKKSQEKGGRHI